MKKDWKYILYISLAFGLFVVVKLLSPKQYDWTVTYSHDDKDPYGAYALNELLPTIFPEKDIRHSYQTLYEIKDSLKRSGSILIVASRFSADEEDTKALLNHVAEGGTAFIAAENFWGQFADTVDVSTYDYFFKEGNIFTKKDTAALRFANPRMDTVHEFYYRRDNIHNYFSRFDTTRTTVIVKNDRGLPVTILVKWGKGNLILNSTPLVFSNIYLLAQQNHELISSMLSYLPEADVEWTEYYHVGRMESRTPLRFILMNEPLSWAYYLTVITVLVFMIFEMKRKQRIIPVIKPLANTTLEFVSTIGNLYFQNKEHKSIAEKKISFLMEHIRTKYWLSTTNLDESFIQTLARKSGRSEESVRALLKTIGTIQGEKEISSAQLIDLNRKIEKFNSTDKPSGKKEGGAFDNLPLN
jgi:hypothetical protein